MILSNEAIIKVDGKWRTLKAILVKISGGKRVIYLDSDGNEVYSQALSKSQFKDIGSSYIDNKIIENTGIVAEKTFPYKTANSNITTKTGVTVGKEISFGGSGGNLPKWVIKDVDGVQYYVKGRSKHGSFEPEAEVCASKLAGLFGVSAIEYSLVIIPQISNQVMCISNNYADNKKVISLYRYIEISTGIDPAQKKGREKFDLVTGMLTNEAKELHSSILYFDYLVGNKDRHLRNFDVWVDRVGKILGMTPMFDTGDSLFATESENEIIRACKSGNNFVHSKPYRNPHYAQLELLLEMGCPLLLNKINKNDLYMVINECFTGNRAKYLNQYVLNNAERLGLLL